MRRIILVFIIVLILIILFFSIDSWINPQIKDIVINGAISDKQLEQFHNHLRPYKDKLFFNVDLSSIRYIVEGFPCVYKATIERVWPNKLLVNIEREILVVKWNHDGFLNHRGKFIGCLMRDISDNVELPWFVGSLNNKNIMWSIYSRLNSLLSHESLYIVKLEMLSGGALELYLNNGIKVLLGNKEFANRMVRMLYIYGNVLSDSANLINTIDIRYTNGIAITWKKI